MKTREIQNFEKFLKSQKMAEITKNDAKKIMKRMNFVEIDQNFEQDF